MIDRTLASKPDQQESFYFQLIPLSLAIIDPQSQLPAPDTTYRFTIYKGLQKFDENKLPIDANFTTIGKKPVLPITSCRLNFYMAGVSRQRKIEFQLKMVQRQNNVDYQVGSYAIDVNQLVDQFKQQNITRHELKVNFSEDYELQFQIYVDTSRVNLEKNIRDKKIDRAVKSPLRARKEGREQPSPNKKNLVQEPRVELTPSKDVENPPQTKTQPVTSIPEPQVAAQQPVQDKKEIRQSRQSNARAPSIHNRSQKNEKVQGSVKSKHSVPLLQTKFKPIATSDTPAEIKMTESQRLGQKIIQEEPQPSKSSNQQSVQQKVFLWAFLGVGMLLIYWAMHPNSRV